MLLITWPGKMFSRLDCSQAYYCIPMADKQSIQLLSFKFGSRTFAFLRLVKGLNRSLSAFTSVVREYLEPLLKADRCAQNVDDIGIAANTPDESIEIVELVFQQKTKSGVKLSMGKCEFSQQQIEYLGETTYPTRRLLHFKNLYLIVYRNSDLQTQSMLSEGFQDLSIYRSYIPQLADSELILDELIRKTRFSS